MHYTFKTNNPFLIWEELSSFFKNPLTKDKGSAIEISSPLGFGNIKYNRIGSDIIHFDGSIKMSQTFTFKFQEASSNSEYLVALFYFGANSGLKFIDKDQIKNLKPYVSNRGKKTSTFISLISDFCEIPDFELKKGTTHKMHILFLKADWLNEIQPDLIQYVRNAPMLAESGNPLMLLPNKTVDFNALFKLLSHYHHVEPCERLIMLGELYTILGNYFSMAFELETGNSVKKSKVHVKDLETIEDLERYIQKHVCETLPSLDELSMKFGMSKTKMCVLFKKVYKESLYNYFIQLKIKKAKELLSQSPKSIGEISEELRIQNKSYFSRIFRKQVGLLPSQYRRSVLSEHFDGT